MASQINNPFSGAAGLQAFGNAMKFDPMGQAATGIVDLARMNKKHELADMMTQNGGQTTTAMNPTALLADKNTQDFHNKQTQFNQGSRGMDIREQNNLFNQGMRKDEFGLKQKNSSRDNSASLYNIGFKEHDLAAKAMDQQKAMMMGNPNHQIDPMVQQRYNQSQELMNAGRDGLMSQYRNKLVNTESGGSYTAKNPNSSAYGKYQQLDEIRNTAVKRGWVKSDAEARSPKGQEIINGHMEKENAGVLKNLGVPLTADSNLTVHQLGAPDAKAFYNGTASQKQLEKWRKNAPIQYKNYMAKKGGIENLASMHKDQGIYMSDADSGYSIDNTGKRTDFRMRSGDAAETFHGFADAPGVYDDKQKARVEQQRKKHGLETTNDLWHMGMLQEAELRMKAEGMPQEQINSYLDKAKDTAFDFTGQMSTVDKFGKEALMGPNLQVGNFGQKDDYGRSMADLTTGGQTVGQSIKGVDRSFNDIGSADFLSNFTTKTQGLSKENKAVATKAAVGGLTTNKNGPRMILHNKPNEVYKEALKDNVQFQDAVYQSAKSMYEKSSVNELSPAEMKGKINNVIKNYPKGSPYIEKLENMSKNVQGGFKSPEAIRGLINTQLADLEKAEDKEGHDGMLELGDSPRGDITNLFDALSEEMDLPDVFNDINDLEDPEVFRAMDNAMRETTGRPFDAAKLVEVYREGVDRGNWLGSDDDIREGSDLAKLMDSFKSTYQKNRGNRDYRKTGRKGLMGTFDEKFEAKMRKDGAPEWMLPSK